MKLPKNFFLDNDKLRNIVSNHLEQKREPSKLSVSYVEGMIQEEIDNVVDEMFGRTDEAGNISSFDSLTSDGTATGKLAPDSLVGVDGRYYKLSDLVELGAEAGIALKRTPNWKQKKTGERFEPANTPLESNPDYKGLDEDEEEASQTGTGEQQDSAKEQGMKPDVVKVAKFMFKHKQLGPALGKIKGDKIESAQLMVLLAQELGIDASDLQKMQVQMKSAMTKAEK